MILRNSVLCNTNIDRTVLGHGNNILKFLSQVVFPLKVFILTYVFGSVYMRVFVRVCVCVCVIVYIHSIGINMTKVQAYRYSRVCVHACICACVCVCLFVYTGMYVSELCACVCLNIYARVFMCTGVYPRVYIGM